MDVILTCLTMASRGFTAFTLRPGGTYRVIRAFTDYAGTRHEVGERWQFIRHSFVPYEDGLTLIVGDDERERIITLQCRPEAQGALVDAFSDYVMEEEAPPG